MKGNDSLIAAIDLGSNAFRLTIGQQVSCAQRSTIEKVKTLREPVRLAEGLRGDALDRLALERGWQALERFGKRLRGFEEGRVRAVATSAVRQARNASTFIAGAEERLGFPIAILCGEEEAHMVYAGVAHSMPCKKTTRLVVDIGGGSTELIVGRGQTPIYLQSLTVGSGTFAKRYFSSGKVGITSMQMAEQAACLQFSSIARQVRQHDWHTAIGSSGTARMLAKILKANGLNDDGASGITYAGLLRLSLCLLEAGHVRRLKLAGLQPHRLGTLPSGLAIMLAAFKVFGIESMSLSEPGLRFGLLHSLVHANAAGANGYR
ncbi:Guanosine-5'-triphosphate,3'-diphosphate pyrophosphatase [compost metagenome]